MKKVLAIILAVTMLLSVGMVSAVAIDNHMDYSKLQPVVGVKVNGTWFIADLTPYKGEDNTWVEIPINPGMLNSGIENYFSLRTNINAAADFSDTSADLYATAMEDASGSLLCSDPWCDNGWSGYNDRNINIQIQIDRGSGWETLSADAEYKQDYHTVLGQFQSGDWYNAARNITLPSFTDVVKARVLVNMHVGKDITPMTSYATLTTYEMNQMGYIYSNDPAIRVRVNGAWYGADLTAYAGQDNTWVTVPIDLSALKVNDSNALQFSSNVKNNGNMDASSADVFFTDSTLGDSFITNHQWCDEGWNPYNDRILNARIELYDGRDWVAIPSDETYTSTGEHTVLGQFQGGTWYNFARNISIGNVDLSQYQGARIAINMHVGANIQCDPYCIWDVANFRDPVYENPTAVLDITAGEGGAISGVPTGTVLVGDPVTLTAAANTDYVFLGWYQGDDRISNANPYDFTVMADVTLVAKFQYVDPTVYYTVTAAAGEGGAIAGAPADRVQAGTQISLTATPNSGYRFVGWYKGETKVNDSAAYAFAATEDVDLIAKFEAIPTYTITAAAAQGGTASGAPAAAVLEGTSVTLIATPANGYSFVGWFEGDIQVSTAAEYTFAAAKDVTLEARFADASHKTTPDEPGAATSTADSDKAAIKIRVNGSWYGTYLEEYKGKNDVWVPVYFPVDALKANEENYFNISSNVINHGNFTDSSVDLYATFTEEEIQSFLTNHQWSDEGWAMYSDRNVNIKLLAYNGSKWVTLAPNETAYYDEHTVVGLFADNETWYNFARNMTVGDLSGYQYACVLVHLSVGDNLEVSSDYVEENFATFVEIPESIPKTSDNMPLVSLIALMMTATAGFVLTVASKKRI